jgi:carbon monoxide dehydrogenase subunit G
MYFHIRTYKGQFFMDIEGTYTLQATPEEVWQCLRNKQALLHTLPEIEQLERIDDFTQSLALRLTYTPLAGTYYGTVQVTERKDPQHYHVLVESVRDTLNTISGEATIDLQQQEDTTIVTYVADVQLSKKGATLQQTVVKGAVKLLLQQFFMSLEEQLWQQRAERLKREQEAANNVAAPQHTVARPRSTGNSYARQSFLHRLVHLLRIGRGDVVEEERWTQRIRRTVFASMLLFLVWVGTRIPRR